MNVRDVMTAEVYVVEPEMSLRDAARMMRDCDIGSLPIQRNERLIGMVTDRDLVIRGIAGGMESSATVESVMSDGIRYCFDDQSVEEVATNMAELQVRRLPVVSREKRLVGFVSLANIASARDRQATDELLGGTAEPH
ncbi:CBS domain-containing protein [Arenimonas terrae]|uniref:CBS domain-containing protein n=1 Tax=Arenimonas terrae TaxID=2546226 RepID=A0A5C4RUN5_9GAMM|nr:CBS domain-containing protein [Arenimonas terrae]TNJ34642.1 CBS domain-containing protein [Arenimonas terrae]